MVHERGQQCELRLGQVHGCFINRHTPGGLIQRDTPPSYDLLDPVPDTAEHRSGARNDLVRVERFDDVIVGPAIQSDDPLGGGFPGCQHDYRNL